MTCQCHLSVVDCVVFNQPECGFSLRRTLKHLRQSSAGSKAYSRHNTDQSLCATLVPQLRIAKGFSRPTLCICHAPSDAGFRNEIPGFGSIVINGEGAAMPVHEGIAGLARKTP
jgi:hypothetical protein